jgi:hypothetical protein
MWLVRAARGGIWIRDVVDRDTWMMPICSEIDGICEQAMQGVAGEAGCA